MRFLVLSDLHIEFEEDYTPPKEGYEAVILAGDTHKGVAGVKWAAAKWPEIPVIYLLGNHEYYGESWDSLVAEIKAAAASNITVLEMEELIIGGVRVLGTTLWSDMKLGVRGSGDASRWVEKQMNDYYKIESQLGYRGRLTARQTMERHAQSKAWLQAKFQEEFAGPTIVVTHHAPSIQGCGWRQAGDLEPAYASDLEDIVAQSGASLWIHGHTHVAKRYMCGEVPVLSNARGYPGENSRGYDPALIIEVGPTGAERSSP